MRISDWSSDVCSSDLLLSHELANVKGRADARVQFAGSLAQPRVIGQAELGGVAAEIPAAGLTLAPGQLHVATLDGPQLQIRRSEERRVGKGCVSEGRYRWAPCHKKTNITNNRE